MELASLESQDSEMSQDLLHQISTQQEDYTWATLKAISGGHTHSDRLSTNKGSVMKFMVVLIDPKSLALVPSVASGFFNLQTNPYEQKVDEK